MIRGTIEQVATDVVVGWVYSDAASVRDKVVLAFVGDQCVGSGKVNVYRQDLEAAGLGDGHVGFHFGISLSDARAVDRVVIRFESSDLSLLQRGQMVAKAPPRIPSDKAHYSRASINWLRDVGWIGQVDFDFLNSLSNLGIYDRSLRPSRDEVLDPMVEVTRLFELFYQGLVAVEKEELPLKGLSSATLSNDSGLLTIAAIHATEGALAIFEGSHTEPVDEAAGTAGAVRHLLRQDRLLFVDTRASFACEGAGTTLVFRARPITEVRLDARRLRAVAE